MTAKTAKHVRYAHRILADLRLRMGNACACCGVPHSDETPLEFDHKIASSRTWSTRKHGLIGSALRYRSDFRAGKLQLLCRPCHELKTWDLSNFLRKQREFLLQDVPF